MVFADWFWDLEQARLRQDELFKHALRPAERPLHAARDRNRRVCPSGGDIPGTCTDEGVR